MIYYWVNKAAYRRVTLFLFKKITYVCIFVWVASTEIDGRLEDVVNKRLPLLLYIYLYCFDLPFIKVRGGKNCSRAGKKN